jgi:hypothetical protein
MLRDINRAQLQEAKNHALELVQDIEQLQDALTSTPDTFTGVLDFGTVKFQAVQNAINSIEILNEISIQSWIGTSLEKEVIA